MKRGNARSSADRRKTSDDEDSSERKEEKTLADLYEKEVKIKLYGFKELKSMGFEKYGNMISSLDSLPVLKTYDSSENEHPYPITLTNVYERKWRSKGDRQNVKSEIEYFNENGLWISNVTSRYTSHELNLLGKMDFAKKITPSCMVENYGYLKVSYDPLIRSVGGIGKLTIDHDSWSSAPANTSYYAPLGKTGLNFSLIVEFQKGSLILSKITLLVKNKRIYSSDPAVSPSATVEEEKDEKSPSDRYDKSSGAGGTPLRLKASELAETGGKEADEDSLTDEGRKRFGKSHHDDDK